MTSFSHFLYSFQKQSSNPADVRWRLVGSGLRLGCAASAALSATTMARQALPISHDRAYGERRTLVKPLQKDFLSFGVAISLEQGFFRLSRASFRAAASDVSFSACLFCAFHMLQPSWFFPTLILLRNSTLKGNPNPHYPFLHIKSTRLARSFPLTIRISKRHKMKLALSYILHDLSLFFGDESCRVTVLVFQGDVRDPLCE